MLRILICCGGGASSGFFALNIEKQVKQLKLEDKVYAQCSAFGRMYQVYDQFDIAMLCPHLRYQIPKVLKDHPEINIPLYVIPPKMYGTMRIEDIVQDALDMIKAFDLKKGNLVHFPNEDESVRIDRPYSYRRSVLKEKNDIYHSLEEFERSK